MDTTHCQLELRAGERERGRWRGGRWRGGKGEGDGEEEGRRGREDERGKGEMRECEREGGNEGG